VAAFAAFFMRYHIDKKRAKRLDEIRESQDRSLADELALIRLLVEESLTTGSAGQTAALLEVARRLAVDDVERAIKERDLLDRTAVVRLAHAMGDAFYLSLEERIEDEELRHEIMDAWGARCKQLLLEAK